MSIAISAHTLPKGSHENKYEGHKSSDLDSRVETDRFKQFRLSL